MTVAVPTGYESVLEASCKTGQPASAMRVAQPVQQAINHVLGNDLGGVRALGQQPQSETDEGTLYFYTYRHPNVDHILAHITGYMVSKSSGSITLTVGSGATQTWSFGDPNADAPRTVVMRAAWGGTGYGNVTIVATDFVVESYMLMDLPRQTLGSGDHRVEDVDSTYARIGLSPEDPIAYSSETGPYAILCAIDDAWDDCCRQAVAFAVPLASATATPRVTSTSTSWTNPFGNSNDMTWRHRARQKTSSVERVAYRARLWTRNSDGGDYRVRVTSTNPGPGADSTITSGTLSNTNFASVDLTSIMVDATDDASIEVEVIRDSGSGTIYVAAFSMVEG